ncbi:hypothetical protein LR48_Vigan06g086600 [Vigna angularis]|uniref:Uncharacterized protein n=1 Tax=Phaseolus angularis TaxID=3914 RepID=A0A0L9TEA0_PHAAN|nr:hypothetical protein LR48_Vigan564s002600 [Vigna angularis]KOM45560.1 hypothetical protein LR48_Vigan06g086600 [Vigna angularis]
MKEESTVIESKWGHGLSWCSCHVEKNSSTLESKTGRVVGDLREEKRSGLHDAYFFYF